MDFVECIDLNGNIRKISREQVRLRPAAYALILDGNKLLLLKLKPTGKYHLPGGGVEAGERIEETLTREVAEETGLEIEVGRLVDFEEEFFYYDPSGHAYHGLHFYYRCQPKTFNLIQDEQVMDGSATSPCWVELETLHPEDFQAHGEVIIRLCKLDEESEDAV